MVKRIAGSPQVRTWKVLDMAAEAPAPSCCDMLRQQCVDTGHLPQLAGATRKFALPCGASLKFFWPAKTVQVFSARLDARGWSVFQIRAGISRSSVDVACFDAPA